MVYASRNKSVVCFFVPLSRSSSFSAATHSQDLVPVSLTKALILSITICNSWCPNITAPSIISSGNCCASDSTIKTDELVPATTKFNSDSSSSSKDGFNIYWPSL